MRQPCAVMVGMRNKEHLRFMLQPPKRITMDNPVAVALKIRAHIAGLFVNGSAFTVSRFAGKFA
jgi:hypothetical protein